MKKILAAMAAGLLIAAFAAWSESDVEKASAGEKAAAAKARDAADLSRAQDKAVANYKKNKNHSAEAEKPEASSSSAGPTAQPKPPAESGADHAKPNPPEKDLTRREAQTEMPTPGQANDHSSTGRETVPSGR